MKPLLILALLVPPPAPLTPAAAPVRQVATLACGGGVFRLESHIWTGKDSPLAPARQSLRLTTPKRPRDVALNNEGVATVEGRRVRRAYVASWACLHARARAYLQLGYACAIDAGLPGACRAGQEWFSLRDDRGRSLDAGLSAAGRDRLYRRLGLASLMADGVPMRSVLGT